MRSDIKKWSAGLDAGVERSARGRHTSCSRITDPSGNARPSMKNVFPAPSELAQTLRLVDADEREIERLEAYERRSRTILALLTVLVAALFVGRVDERRVAVFVALLLVAAGLLPYLAVLLRRRALERRRDRVLNSGSDEG